MVSGTLKRFAAETIIVKEVTDADREIGRRIKEARLARQISAKTLGVAVNVTFQQMQKYETGINRISASRLVNIAKFLNVPITELLGESENSLLISSYTPRAHALAGAFDRLPESAVKSRLYAFVLALTKDVSSDPIN